MTLTAPAGAAHRRDDTRAHAVLRFLAPPNEVDAGGTNVQAGHVLEWIDRAGSACAAGWSASYCVTAYMGNVHFTRPIPVGRLVETRARVVGTGRTSMHVLVTVETAEPTVGAFERVAHCLLVFVAVGADGSPTAVPAWRPASAHDLELMELAAERVAARGRIRAAMEAQAYTDEGTTPRLLLRFLAARRDVNWGGRVHGGTVMRWIDEAAAVCARSWTKRPTVGVYAGGIHFHRPIEIGQLIEVETRILHTGAHSVHVATHVRSADPEDGVFTMTTRCVSVFVPLDDAGGAAAIRPVPLISDEDRRLDLHARTLVRMRAALDSIA